jgi:hypothetical protein
MTDNGHVLVPASRITKNAASCSDPLYEVVCLETIPVFGSAIIRICTDNPWRVLPFPNSLQVDKSGLLHVVCYIVVVDMYIVIRVRFTTLGSFEVCKHETVMENFASTLLRTP